MLVEAQDRGPFLPGEGGLIPRFCGADWPGRLCVNVIFRSTFTYQRRAGVVHRGHRQARRQIG